VAGSSAQTLRQRDPAVRGWLPLELERRHRRGDALQLQATERTEAMTVTRARELAHQSIDDDLPPAACAQSRADSTAGSPK
jgi:hypothetical protein